jgi:hypothetical protein
LAEGFEVVAELFDPLKRQALEGAGPDRIVCAQGFTPNILAQSVVNPGLQEVLLEVLSFDHGNEVYRVPGEGGLNVQCVVGKTFDEALRFCREGGILLLAVQTESATRLSASKGARPVWAGPRGWSRSGGRILLNPSGKDSEREIREGDSLLVLAEDRESLLKVFGD